MMMAPAAMVMVVDAKTQVHRPNVGAEDVGGCSGRAEKTQGERSDN